MGLFSNRVYIRGKGALVGGMFGVKRGTAYQPKNDLRFGELLFDRSINGVWWGVEGIYYSQKYIFDVG